MVHYSWSLYIGVLTLLTGFTQFVELAVPTFITLACSAATANAPGTCNDVVSSVAIATGVYSSYDAGWIEVSIKVQTSGKTTSTVAWSAKPPDSTPALTEYESLTCAYAGSAVTATYTAAPNAADTTTMLAIASIPLATAIATLPSTLPPLMSVKNDNTNAICLVAIALSTGLMYDYRKATSTLYVGKVVSSAAPATNVGTGLSAVTGLAALPVAPATSYISGWTWYYNYGNAAHLGQIFGRSIDSCDTDNCVAMRFEMVTGGAVLVTVRARLKSTIYPATANAASYVVGLSNKADGSSAIIGFACNVASLAGSGTVSGVGMTVLPVKFSGISTNGMAFPMITTTKATIFNSLYGIVECNAQFPVTAGATDVLNWTLPIYVYYKGLFLSAAPTDPAAAFTSFFSVMTADPAKYPMFSPSFSLNVAGTASCTASSNTTAGTGSSTPSGNITCPGKGNGAPQYLPNWFVTIFMATLTMFCTNGQNKR